MLAAGGDDVCPTYHLRATQSGHGLPSDAGTAVAVRAGSSAPSRSRVGPHLFRNLDVVEAIARASQPQMTTARAAASRSNTRPSAAGTIRRLVLIQGLGIQLVPWRPELGRRPPAGTTASSASTIVTSALPTKFPGAATRSRTWPTTRRASSRTSVSSAPKRARSLCLMLHAPDPSLGGMVAQGWLSEPVAHPRQPRSFGERTSGTAIATVRARSTSGANGSASRVTTRSNVGSVRGSRA